MFFLFKNFFIERHLFVINDIKPLFLEYID